MKQGKGNYLVLKGKKPQKCRKCNRVIKRGSKYSKCSYCMEDGK